MHIATKSAIAAWFIAATMGGAAAADFRAPVVIEPDVLQVGREGEELVSFGLKALDALPQVKFDTSTIWTDEINTYSGVPVAVLIEEAGLADRLSDEDAVLELIALNDYRVRIPLAEIEDNLPIVATRVDGRTFSIRDRGPYWLVYPYDRAPEYRTEDTFKRSIWQLTQMVVLE
ncbi:oxidoreductase [Limimaricola sp.]|uniref:oxidoreductase n=1 Tax=Limimaricola sp. TaxID=2211665 RepID=UPI00405827A0